MSRFAIFLIAPCLCNTFVSTELPNSKMPIDHLEEDTFLKIMGQVFSGALMLPTLYSEIFAISSGVRVISSEPLGNEDQRFIAIAITNLWMKLPFTEEMSSLLFDSMASFVSDLPPEKDLENANVYVERMLTAVENNVLADPALASVYREQKQKARQLRLSPLVFDPNITQTPVYQSNPRFCEFLLRHQLFEYVYPPDIKIATSVKLQRHLLLQAVTQLAKPTTTKGDKIQTIFDDTVRTVARKFYHLSETENRKVHRPFFSTLEEKFKVSSELFGELVTMKNNLHKKYTSRS